MSILQFTFASVKLLAVYACIVHSSLYNTRGLLQEAFVITSAESGGFGHSDDRGVISSLGSRLGFRMGKVLLIMPTLRESEERDGKG